MIRRSAFVGVIAAVLGFATAGCGGDNSDPPESNKPAENGSGGNGMGGSGSEKKPGFECDYTAVPNENITDFASWSSGGEWQVDDSLSGGSFDYNGNSSTITATHDAEAENMHIEAKVEDYAGFGLWFGPCSDASEFSGVQFTISGTISNGGTLDFQVQTSRNYPIDTENTKGECEGTFDDNCGFNTKSNVVVTETAEVVQVPWGDLVGGKPLASLDPTELLGIQWQFNCPSDAEEPCEVDVVIDDVTFY